MRILVMLISMFGIAGCDSKPSTTAFIRATADTSTLRQQAEAMATATLARDNAAVVDRMHPKAVAASGGRARVIEQLEQTQKDMDADKVKMSAFEIGAMGKLSMAGETGYVVIPTIYRFTDPAKIGEIESFLLAITDDGGKKWMFADGGGLKNPALRNAVFDNLPAGLQFPESRPAVFTDVAK